MVPSGVAYPQARRSLPAGPGALRMFDPAHLIHRLAHAPAAFRAMIECFPEAQSRWKPAPEHWSVTEIIAHVADEETEDFRPRLMATLAGAPWPPLDLDRVAERRGYNCRDALGELTRFEASRRESVTYLSALVASNPDWSNAHQHPKFGPIRAGDLLTSWAAHDALHLRQLARRLHNLAEADASELGCSVRYAGEW